MSLPGIGTMVIFHYGGLGGSTVVDLPAVVVVTPTSYNSAMDSPGFGNLAALASDEVYLKVLTPEGGSNDFFTNAPEGTSAGEFSLLNVSIVAEDIA